MNRITGEDSSIYATGWHGLTSTGKFQNKERGEKETALVDSGRETIIIFNLISIYLVLINVWSL